MKHLLLITGGQPGGRLERLAAAVRAGAEEFAEEVELRARPALQAGRDDLLWANGLLIGTPEKFGYMAGAVKDFFDRTFYAVEGQVAGMPYAIFVSAGNDGTGAVTSVERIATGYRWLKVADAVIVRGDPSTEALDRCRELGQTLAAGLAAGIF
ncbi:MAG TPA: NAD(P)H-dependent oxidoreductase [Steroidobacteraceae bacterium]|nr:NAD(P)H-dependent oxidoreductase [Steroidobacteraceae bacterium]